MKPDHRPPAVAGRFYPRDKSALLEKLAEFCPPFSEPKAVPAILVPHAGYVYSGRFAGQAFRRVAPCQTAIVLCPNHTGFGQRISVWDRGAWQTPLGSVEVDEAMAAELLEGLGESKGDRDAHFDEHAIEVQVPFLQFLWPQAKLVPVVLGPLSLERCQAVGRALAAVQKAHPGTLLVASTDMSHYISADEAKQKDELALAEVRALRSASLYRTVSQNEISMCGFIPSTAVLSALEAAPHKPTAEILAYGHSGEVTGELSSVVAYASAWFV